MSITQQRPSDLRAKANEFLERAARVQDSELHDQFLDLAQRYIALADRQERDAWTKSTLPQGKG